eukprot:scaffold11394_cov183-Amphora_coffeaeformis.AAC.4
MPRGRAQTKLVPLLGYRGGYLGLTDDESDDDDQDDSPETGNNQEQNKDLGMEKEPVLGDATVESYSIELLDSDGDDGGDDHSDKDDDDDYLSDRDAESESDSEKTSEQNTYCAAGGPFA